MKQKFLELDSVNLETLVSTVWEKLQKQNRVANAVGTIGVNGQVAQLIKATALALERGAAYSVKLEFVVEGCLDRTEDALSLIGLIGVTGLNALAAIQLNLGKRFATIMAMIT